MGAPGELKVTLRHVVVVHGDTLWAAVPANNGANGPQWQWGKELLVGFTAGTFSAEAAGHQCTKDSAFESRLARSTDGGESWSVEAPQGYVGQAAPPEAPGIQAPLPAPADFTTPGFLLRVEGHGYHGNSAERWFTSTDRGATWSGPLGLGGLLDAPELAGMEFTGRTAYLVDGPRDLTLFLSARRRADGEPLKVALAEKPFVARTTDGGKTFRFLSWMVPWTDPARAVMPAPVRIGPGRMVAALRRKSPTSNWIECVQTMDGCRSWLPLARVGETETNNRYNGNPPAMIAHSSGSLCCVYGNRTDRVILARWSADAGGSWDAPVVLRSDFHSANGWPDLGYARLFERPDGRLVAAYFWCTTERPQTHVAATIFEPGRTGP